MWREEIEVTLTKTTRGWSRTECFLFIPQSLVLKIKAVGSTRTSNGKCLPSAVSPTFLLKATSWSVFYMPSMNLS